MLSEMRRIKGEKVIFWSPFWKDHSGNCVKNTPGVVKDEQKLKQNNLT